MTNFEAREIGVLMFGSSVNLGLLLCLLAMTHAPQDGGGNENAGVHHPAPSLARCTLAKVFSLPLIPCQSPGFIFNLLESRLFYSEMVIKLKFLVWGTLVPSYFLQKQRSS